jgi:hypothetical protein
MLIVSAGLAIGYAIAFDRIHDRLLPLGPPMFVYHGSRGPFSGTKVDDGWIVGQAKSRFRGGDDVLWQVWADLNPGVTMIEELHLICGDQDVQTAETRVGAADLHHGWNTFAITIPIDIVGTCSLHPQLHFLSPEGFHLQDYDLRSGAELLVAAR